MRSSRGQRAALRAVQRAAWCAAVVVVSALLVGCAEEVDRPPVLFADEVRWRAGDDATWAAADFDDSAWEAIGLQDLRGSSGIFWFRVPFELTPRHAGGIEPMAFWFSAMATCDLYWDGHPLSLAGVPGADLASEVPGPIDARVYVPTSAVTAGPHLLAARCSTHHRQLEPTTGFYVLGFGPYATMVRWSLEYSWKAMASLTAKLVAAAYFLAVFFLRRRSTSPLWLGLFSLAAAALLVAEAWRSLVGYSYDWHIPRLVAVHWLAWLCNALLVLYFLTRFPGRRRVALALGLFGASLAIWWLVPTFDSRVGALFLLALTACLIWGVGALRRSLPGSALATAGVALCLAVFVIDPSRFLDQRVFLILDALIALLLVSQAVQQRRERDALEAERLRSTRLELELVKKTIQPHFLMNTLTALAEWFEREPAVAGEVIEALSREIRLLGDLADRRTVPFASELELCRAHLEVMGFRHGGRYVLVAKGIDETAPCPPGIVHTMVENAVTHGPTPGEDEVRLHLRGEVVEGGRRYRLSAPVGSTVKPPREGGTGLRYVRTRLAEAFGDDFTFHAGARDGFWVNEWSVPDAEATA